MLTQEQTLVVQRELVETIAGAIRGIAIENRISQDQVIACLLGAQGVPAGDLVARIARRAAESSPAPDTPTARSRPSHKNPHAQSRWKIPPFKKGT